MSEAAEQARKRARAHLRQATLEGLEAARELLLAAMLSGGLGDAPANSLAGQLRRTLEELIARVRDNTSFVFPPALAAPLIAALDGEIRRWEKRSEEDADARPVLRAFIGLRELLWELGLRKDEAPRGQASKAEEPTAPSPDRAERAPRRARVERFDVED